MANLNAPFGLRPVRVQGGQPYNGTGINYATASGDSTAIFVGDPVIRTAGTNSAQLLNFPPNTLGIVARASASSGSITGVMVARVPTNENSAAYRLASSIVPLIICDNPQMVYEIQTDGVTTYSDTWIGKNANVTFGTAGSTVSGASGAMIDTSTIATTSSLQLKIVGLARTINNEAGQYEVVQVMINQNTDVANTSGV